MATHTTQPEEPQKGPKTIEEQLFELRDFDVTIAATPIGRMPEVKPGKFPMHGTERFEKVYDRLRDLCITVKPPSNDPIADNSGSKDFYVYIADNFEPRLSDYIADLFNCYRTGDVLAVKYSFEKSFS